tara:strand:+ start:2844 stop:3248 length:405 start_codon:yes stop_codon:yes gene_type:complete
MSSLLDIGTKVIIATNQIKDRIPDKLNKQLTEHTEATLIDYKMTDGRGVGYVLKLNSGEKIWVFKSELSNFDYDDSLDDLSSEELLLNFLSEKTKNTLNNLTRETRLTGTEEVVKLLNPKYFIRWILYVTADIF